MMLSSNFVVMTGPCTNCTTICCSKLCQFNRRWYSEAGQIFPVVSDNGQPPELVYQFRAKEKRGRYYEPRTHRTVHPGIRGKR